MGYWTHLRRAVVLTDEAMIVRGIIEIEIVAVIVEIDEIEDFRGTMTEALHPPATAGIGLIKSPKRPKKDIHHLVSA